MSWISDIVVCALAYTLFIFCVALLLRRLFRHGCSTLDMRELFQDIDASEGGAVSVLTQGAGAIGLEDVETGAA
jgi:hypothetical protein